MVHGPKFKLQGVKLRGLGYRQRRGLLLSGGQSDRGKEGLGDFRARGFGGMRRRVGDLSDRIFGFMFGVPKFKFVKLCASAKPLLLLLLLLQRLLLHLLILVLRLLSVLLLLKLCFLPLLMVLLPRRPPPPRPFLLLTTTTKATAATNDLPPPPPALPLLLHLHIRQPSRQGNDDCGCKAAVILREVLHSTGSEA